MRKVCSTRVERARNARRRLQKWISYGDETAISSNANTPANIPRTLRIGISSIPYIFTSLANAHTSKNAMDHTALEIRTKFPVEWHGAGNYGWNITDGSSEMLWNS